MLVFAVGSGISAFEGFQHILHPKPLEHLGWNYALLAVSFCFEGTSLVIAMRELITTKGKHSLWGAIRASKDPAVFAVIFEDSAALLGLVIAFVGLYLGSLWNLPTLDGLASVFIGVLLALVALLLARETKDLLVGEGANRETIRSIRQVAEGETVVERAGYPFTMYFGPASALLAMKLQFRPHLNATEIEASIRRIEILICEKHPEIRHVFLEAERVTPVTRLKDQEVHAKELK